MDTGKGCYFLAFVQLFEKYGTLIERYTALIEKVSALIRDEEFCTGWMRGKTHPATGEPLSIARLALPPGS
eukprot:SAG31_NODE_20742_length_566_cov_1.117773_1_plen_70_part_10